MASFINSMIMFASAELLVESNHPYANNYLNTWTISEPGASQIRIHFEKIDLKSGDYVKILDEDGNYLVVYGGSSANIYLPLGQMATTVITPNSIYRMGSAMKQTED